MIVVNSGQVFDYVQRRVCLNQRNKNGQNLQHRKKDNLEEQVQKVCIELHAKDSINANSGLVFAEKVELVKQTQKEQEKIETVDCLLLLVIVAI